MEVMELIASILLADMSEIQHGGSIAYSCKGGWASWGSCWGKGCVNDPDGAHGGKNNNKNHSICCEAWGWR